jgi:acetolactate synthase-1/3 small subunit
MLCLKSNPALLFDEKQIKISLKKVNSQIVTVSRDFVISKSVRSEIEELYAKLKPYGIMQFVRSGRISVSKEKWKFQLLEEELKNK